MFFLTNYQITVYSTLFHINPRVYAEQFPRELTKREYLFITQFGTLVDRPFGAAFIPGLPNQVLGVRELICRLKYLNGNDS